MRHGCCWEVSNRDGCESCCTLDVTFKWYRTHWGIAKCLLGFRRQCEWRARYGNARSDQCWCQNITHVKAWKTQSVHIFSAICKYSWLRHAARQTLVSLYFRKTIYYVFSYFPTHFQALILLLSVHAWWSIIGVLPSVSWTWNYRWSYSCLIHKIYQDILSRTQNRRAGLVVASICITFLFHYINCLCRLNYCLSYVGLYFGYLRLISVW